MLEQISWLLMRLAILVGLLGVDVFLSYLIVDTIKERDWLPAMICVILGLFSFSSTAWILGRLTGW